MGQKHDLFCAVYFGPLWLTDERQGSMPGALYIASAIGAIALFMMMPRRGYNPRAIGALLGAFTLGGLWLVSARRLPPPGALGLPGGAMPYYYVFSALAIGAAVRVITHTKPVFAALWFVMVVLSSAGLLVILSATFMAFAMVIIYAGAILVTYVFVIMLAAQAGGSDVTAESPEYERVAREPAAAVAVGFILLATLLAVMFERMEANPEASSFAQGLSDAQLIHGRDGDTATAILTQRAAARLVEQLGEPSLEAVLRPDKLHNSERIGFDLFNSHPLGLELAGVILSVSLIGAVVLARQRVEAETTAVPTE